MAYQETTTATNTNCFNFRAQRKRIVTLCLVVAALLPLRAQILHDLDISVVLAKNGDAQITETRRMTITDEGTECYIKLCNTGNSIVKDLTVVDEQGTQFESLKYWSTDWSRAEKTHKCGIMMPAKGYELCWGLGESGERTYTTSYRLTNLVEGYTDSDGFNWMFVARNLKPMPQHVRLTITAEDGTLLTDSIANIWAFGYGGDIHFRDSAIVAETTEAFKDDDGMIVMCEFAKGLFSPSQQYAESFETVKARAFEGSDYLEEEDDGEPWWQKALKWICGGGLIFLALCGLLWEPVERMVNKFRFRNVAWYRDIPLGGDLALANSLQNDIYQTFDYNKLLTASLLKLVQLGAIGIDGSTGKPRFTVKPWTGDESLPNFPLLKSIYDIFRNAAGDDRRMDPHELTNYMNNEKNETEMFSFVGKLHGVHLISASTHKTDTIQLLGLKKFLEEFTLIDEREVQEVALWKDYMVWATLFGCATTVVKQMQKINPEYFKMDSIASSLAYSAIEPSVTERFVRTADNIHTRKVYYEDPLDSGSRRRSGGGGHASRGGGGFSGGGGGGGIR